MVLDAMLDVHLFAVRSVRTYVLTLLTLSCEYSMLLNSHVEPADGADFCV